MWLGQVGLSVRFDFVEVLDTRWKYMIGICNLRSVREENKLQYREGLCVIQFIGRVWTFTSGEEPDPDRLVGIRADWVLGASSGSLAGSQDQQQGYLPLRAPTCEYMFGRRSHENVDGAASEYRD